MLRDVGQVVAVLPEEILQACFDSAPRAGSVGVMTNDDSRLASGGALYHSACHCSRAEVASVRDFRVVATRHARQGMECRDPRD